MRCSNCNAKLKNNAKFCSECGSAVGKAGLCHSCGADNEASAKFCKDCGTALQGGQLVNYERGGGSIVLTEKHLAHIYKLFFHQIESRFAELDEDSSPHTFVSAFDAESIKLDLVDSLNDISRYLIRFVDRGQKIQINFINQIIVNFLKENAAYLCQLLDRLDVLKEEVIENVSDSGVGGFFKGGLAGIGVAAAIPVVGWMGIALAALGGLAVGDSMEKEEQRVMDKWNQHFQKVLKAYDDLWGGFVDILFDEIMQNTDIEFQIDNQKYKQLLENKG
ncbi:MAG: zinc ribbon domain-containing protein [Elusimicrobiota bacterium]|jgi:hypothetical protein|nr:zinc ribbon domain-containing protein [Elusimicrobiota bacterium]